MRDAAARAEDWCGSNESRWRCSRGTDIADYGHGKGFAISDDMGCRPGACGAARVRLPEAGAAYPAASLLIAGKWGHSGLREMWPHTEAWPGRPWMRTQCMRPIRMLASYGVGGMAVGLWRGSLGRTQRLLAREMDSAWQCILGVRLTLICSCLICRISTASKVLRMPDACVQLCAWMPHVPSLLRLGVCRW